jgi:hypothetical protein
MVKKSDEGDGGGVDTIKSKFDEGEPLEEVPWEHKRILFFFLLNECACRDSSRKIEVER